MLQTAASTAVAVTAGAGDRCWTGHSALRKVVAMRRFRTIAVYCGSSTQVDPAYLKGAYLVGKALAERGIGIVYGGGKAGLMGQVADGALAQGGEVTGVITEKLLGLEVGHTGLSRRYVVTSMQSRKTMMAQLADAFIALPGGVGTLEELFEAATWTQLNYHLKPVGLLNMNGYYDALVAFWQHAVEQRFVRPAHRDLIQVASELGDLLQRLATVPIAQLGQWEA